MKVLVIVDMQNDFLTGPLGNEHCRSVIPEVKKLIEKGDWDCIYATQDSHYDNYSKTLEGEKLPVPHCKVDTHGWKIEESIFDLGYQTTDCFRTLCKPTFGSTDLPKQILEEYRFKYGEQALEILGRGNDLEFHVCGVCTSICVLANVVLLRAHFPDATIFVHTNACGDVTKEMHEAAKICFKSQQCEVVGEWEPIKPA